MLVLPMGVMVALGVGIGHIPASARASGRSKAINFTLSKYRAHHGTCTATIRAHRRAAVPKSILQTAFRKNSL
jgi:hypothetical protein